MAVRAGGPPLLPVLPDGRRQGAGAAPLAGRGVPARAPGTARSHRHRLRPRTWESPEQFSPERFRHWDESAYDFIPQGGGDHWQGHRGAGEWITIDVLAAAVRFLSREVDYDVPAQDLRVSTRRMPTAPRSGFVLANVRAAVSADHVESGGRA